MPVRERAPSSGRTPGKRPILPWGMLCTKRRSDERGCGFMPKPSVAPRHAARRCCRGEAGRRRVLPDGRVQWCRTAENRAGTSVFGFRLANRWTLSGPMPSAAGRRRSPWVRSDPASIQDFELFAKDLGFPSHPLQFLDEGGPLELEERRRALLVASRGLEALEYQLPF